MRSSSFRRLKPIAESSLNGSVRQSVTRLVCGKENLGKTMNPKSLIIFGGGIIGAIINSFIGAVILLVILRLIKL
jgi:hypothetical protein